MAGAEPVIVLELPVSQVGPLLEELAAMAGATSVKGWRQGKMFTRLCNTLIVEQAKATGELVEYSPLKHLYPGIHRHLKTVGTGPLPTGACPPSGKEAA